MPSGSGDHDMGLIEIPFDDDMWAECKRISLARSAPKRRWKKNFEDGNHSDDIHFMGVVGEAAACVFFGCELNREINGGDKHEPDIVTGGIGIEVKASKYSPPHLKFTSMEWFGRRSHIAVVVHVDLYRRVGTLWGYMDRREFAERHEVASYGHGSCLVMKPPYRDMLALKGIYLDNS